jgi:hypothetical protein
MSLDVNGGSKVDLTLLSDQQQKEGTESPTIAEVVNRTLFMFFPHI